MNPKFEGGGEFLSPVLWTGGKGAILGEFDDEAPGSSPSLIIEIFLSGLEIFPMSESGQKDHFLMGPAGGSLWTIFINQRQFHGFLGR